MDEHVRYKPGELIFKQGDEGRSLLMIKEGSVEVYQDTPQGEVVLTVQNAGEVVGILSFFQHGRRMANARARTQVEGQLVERKDGPGDPLAKLPKWVQVVLKEFGQRLGQMNEQYVRAWHERNDLKGQMLDPLFMSTQLANCLAELSPLKVKKLPDGREFVVLEQMLAIVESCLGYDPAELKRVLDIFKNTGLIKVELDPDHGKEIVSLATAQRLKWYSEFVQSARSGKTRKLVQASIPFKHRKMLFALRDYVQKTGGDINKTSNYDLAELVEKFETVTKVHLDQGIVEAAERLGFLTITKAGSKTTISFNSATLSRTLIAILTIKRLRSDMEAEGENEGHQSAS